MSTDSAPSVAPADLADPRVSAAVVELLAFYADDADSGGGEPLSTEARANLVAGLRTHPTAVVLLATVDDVPVGLAVGFEGYSTFTARPLLNLHDLVVNPEWRGRGVGGALLEAFETEARRRGCAWVTLEVLGANAGAQRLYRRHGFVGGAKIDPPTAAMFWKKRLE